MSLFSVQIYKRKGLLTSSVSHVLPAIGVHTFSGRASFVHEIAAESEIKYCKLCSHMRNYIFHTFKLIKQEVGRFLIKNCNCTDWFNLFA